MELIQQVKNFSATLEHTQRYRPTFKAQDKDVSKHERALQALSNGFNVPYEDTLRIVSNAGNRGPRLPPRVTQKHPGYIRNESGGLFTS